MRNLNLLFNKTYYDALTASSFRDEEVKDVNNMIYRAAFVHERDYTKPQKMVNHHFLMTVSYPGLLVGIGNAHSAGISNEEIAVGFSFDYVTGQPYIPGSTVKGVLRSHFKDHSQAVMALADKSEAEVKELESQIFDGNDIFFDAVVYDGDEYGFLMGSEYITPHSSPTENPVPIQLIKVLPGVRFEFRFHLNDSDLMTAADKERLFQALLSTFGIGAKTNVGFGILQADPTNGAIRPKKSLPPEEPQSRQEQRPPRQPEQQSRTSGNTAGQDSARCPHCGRWNKRFNPNNGRENRNWVTGVCFNCGGKLR